MHREDEPVAFGACPVGHRHSQLRLRPALDGQLRRQFGDARRPELATVEIDRNRISLVELD